MNQLDLKDIQRTLHPKKAEYTFVSSAHGTFSMVGHMLGRQKQLSMNLKS